MLPEILKQAVNDFVGWALVHADSKASLETPPAHRRPGRRSGIESSRVFNRAKRTRAATDPLDALSVNKLICTAVEVVIECSDATRVPHAWIASVAMTQQHAM